jgi:hypothetical protein
MELIPTLQERFDNPQWQNVLSKEIEARKNQMKYYEFNEGDDAKTP